MLAAVLASAILAPQTPHLNWNGPASRVLTGKVNSNSYRVEIKQANFKLGTRTLSWRKHEGYDIPVTGTAKKPRSFYGHDLGKDQLEGMTLKQFFEKRFTEIVILSIKWKSKSIPVAKSLYDDLLNPNLGPDDLKVKAAKNGGLAIEMIGSDGAGSYMVTWTVSTHNTVSRKIESLD